jgi:SAM-dependent methyltransferase
MDTSLVGLDLADAAIRRAAERISARTSRAPMAERESDERFDVIVFNECLYYFDDPVALVRKYERFLRDDGVFIVSMYGVDRTEWLCLHLRVCVR